MRRHRLLLSSAAIGIADSVTGLFEKFYRADNALAIESEGTWLGLHLVRLVVAVGDHLS